MAQEDNNKDFESLAEVISKAIVIGLAQSGIFAKNNPQNQDANTGRNSVDWQVNQKNDVDSYEKHNTIDYNSAAQENSNFQFLQPDMGYDQGYDSNVAHESYNHSLPLYDNNGYGLNVGVTGEVGNTPTRSDEIVVSGQIEGDTDNRSASQIAGRIYGSEWVVMQNELLYAIGDLSADERKLIMYLSPLVRRMVDKDPKQNTFNVVASDFADFYDMETKHVYKKLEDISNLMINKSFFLWNFYKNEKQGATNKESSDKRGISWLGEASYRKKKGVLEVELTSTVISMLTVFDKMHPYTKYQRSLIINLPHYGIVLFELIMSCMHQQFKKKTFTVDYLREKFNCMDSYPKIAEFKRNVIDNAVKDVNELGVMTVSYDQKKTGREITHIVFSFTDDSEGALGSMELTEEDGDTSRSQQQATDKNLDTDLPFGDETTTEKVVARKAKPKSTPIAIEGDLFKSESQRREFAERLSQLKQLEHMATGATNTYEAFAKKIYDDLKDVSKQGFYKPFLDMVQFNATKDDYYK